MAVNYVGNQDFRGYLAYLAGQGDFQAKNAITGYDGRGYIDNEGQINRGALNEYNQMAADGSGPSDAEIQQREIDYLNGQFSNYQAALNPTQYRGGGGSGATAQDKADEQAYWQDQMDSADQQIGRLNTQLTVGDQNIDKSYQSAYDRLVGDKEVTTRDYNTKRGQTVEDNVTAKGNINASVRNRNTGLQRLLGSKGAGNSSAAQILAPYAAAKEGSAQRNQVNTAYGRNIGGLDTAYGDYEKDWLDSSNDLGTQRETQKQTLRSGVNTSEAKLQEEKANAAVQKAQAGGQNYMQARGARAPYMARISSLIQQIDSLGANPALQARAATYKAPELAQYTYDKYAAPSVGSGVDPNLAQGAGAYWSLLQGQKKKEAIV